MRSRGKDYEREATAVGQLIRENRPGASSLLDVACGTGLHLQFLASAFDRVEGLDLSDDMLELTSKLVPGVRVHVGDMRDFQLSSKFDAITCMFAIPHLQSNAELRQTIEGLTHHLTPGGILVIEPWFRPFEFLPGYVASDVVRRDGRAVHRVSHSIPEGHDGDRVRMTVHYVDADPDAGIRHFTETVRLSLFTDAQYQNAFAAAGCAAEFFPLEGFVRGVWVARRSY
ncbi:methyltransferase type 11 [Streptomyces albus subsp. albus]|nr:methyltransferase type 11 [Streptomyces albus subsp. albus]